MDGKLPLNDDFVDLLIKVLAASQLFMRHQKVLLQTPIFNNTFLLQEIVKIKSPTFMLPAL